MSRMISTGRTLNYLRQIKGAVFYRAVAMAASFLVIPIMIRYLGQEQFGVWSTLLTVMSWIVFFDLGIGHGLRNKVAESLAKNDPKEAAGFVASGYTMIGFVALVMWALVTLASYFLPWQAVFNTTVIPESTIRETVQVAVFFVVLNFWIGLIGALLGAVQKTALVAFGQLVSNVLVLAFVYFLAKVADASIFGLAIVYGVSLVASNILLSVWFYMRYPELRPSARLAAQHVRPLVAVGAQFFIIQIAVLVIFTTDKMLITQLFGPEYVTQYEVVFKLFSLITFAHGLINTPLWSAYTDAYHRNDFVWVKSMLKSQVLIFTGFAFAIGFLILTAPFIIELWIGERFIVPGQLIVLMGLFTAVSVWNNVFAVFLNGIGEIRLQLYTSILAMLVNIPLSIFLAKNTALGSGAVVAGTICSLLLAAICLPIQVCRLVNNSKGIFSI